MKSLRADDRLTAQIAGTGFCQHRWGIGKRKYRPYARGNRAFLYQARQLREACGR
jgi:hypothetical protein